MKIDGARVLLTGATGGLGQAIARELSARGAQLTLTGRRLELLEPLATELGGRALAADLSEREALESLLSALDPVDILVANAALPGSGRLDSFSVEQLDRALEVNLRAPIALARALVPAMVERRRGHLVFMSSLSGKSASGAASLYNATKFGLRGFTLGLRDELRPSGIGVSGIYPGFIRDAGMFADSGVTLPQGVGSRTPQDVAAAVTRAILHNRAEIDVAPLQVRLGAAFGALAPETWSRLSGRLGAADVSQAVADGQRAKR